MAFDIRARLILRLIREGMTYEEVAFTLRISRQAIHRRIQRNPDFATAVAEAREEGRSNRERRQWYRHPFRGKRPPTGKGHGGKGNVRNHRGTLEDFPDYSDPASEWSTVWMPWMKSLPVALDLGGFRAVHACWHPAHLPVLLEGNFEDYDFLVASADKSSPEGMAVEAVLKGIEVPLPEGFSFKTPVGSTKHDIRVRWWEVTRRYAEVDGLTTGEADGRAGS